MVSLGDNHRSPGGGYFFNSETPQMFDETDEASLISSVLVTEGEPAFRTIPIASVIFLEISFTIGLAVSAFVIPHFSTYDACFVLNLIHVAYWCLLFVTSGYRNYHHCRIQRYGYLEFFRKTQLLQKIPLIVPTIGNAALLVCSVLFEKYCPYPETCPIYSEVHCYNYIQMFFGAELILLLPCLIKYMILVVRFNRSKNTPDIHQDELLVSHAHGPSNEVGFREEDYMEELVEKQADMIRYLKQHSNNLSRKIMQLTSQVNILQGHSQKF